MDTDTKYAYDPIDKVPVFIGNREDWTVRNNNRWYEPTRDDAEIAEHQSWGRTYVCCDDPNCASPVIAAQGEVRAWHFRRKSSPEKPKHCVNCERFSGESSFHWKTAFNIEKILQRLHRNGERWLGKDIAFVQREQDRLFPIGEEGVRLRPDVFVMFADGDWLAIEIVYAHRPEMHHHEAYKPLASGDTTFGPRVVVVDLNDALPEINEDTHRLWVREGGIEEVLAREASEMRRMARFEERQSHFNSRSAAKTLEAKTRFMNQIEREFPDFTWSQVPPIDATPAEAEEGFVAQRREQLKRDALQRHFNRLVSAHEGRTYSLNLSDFNSTEAIEQAFQACFEEMSQRHEGIMDLNARFTFLNIPREFMDERPEQFDDWLTKMEASAAKCQAALEEARVDALEAGCDEDSLDVLNGFILDHETKDVNDYIERLEACVNETVRANYLNVVETKVGEFEEATGFDMSNSQNGFTCEDLAEFFDLGGLTTWLNEVETYLQAVDIATTEALCEWEIDVDLQEKLRSKVRSEVDVLQSTNLDGVSSFVKQCVDDGMFLHFKSTIRSNLGIAVPTSVLENVGRDPHELRSWMERAQQYQERCEALRQSAISVAKQENKSRFCEDKIKALKVPYDDTLNPESFASTLKQILDKYGSVGSAQDHYTITGRRRRPTRDRQSRRVVHRKKGTMPDTIEPSAVERVKAEIADLENQKLRQIDVLNDRKRTWRDKKGARYHRDRITREIGEARTKLDRLEAEEARSSYREKLQTAENLLSTRGGVRGGLNTKNVRPAPYNKHLNGKLGGETKTPEKKQKPSERLRDLQSRSEETKKRANQLSNETGSE